MDTRTHNSSSPSERQQLKSETNTGASPVYVTSQSRDHWTPWSPWLVTTVVAVVAVSVIINQQTTPKGDDVQTISTQLDVIAQLIKIQTESMDRTTTTLTVSGSTEVNKQLSDILRHLKQLSESVEVQADAAVETSTNIERVYNKLKTMAQLAQADEQRQHKENLTTLINSWTQLLVNITTQQQKHLSEKSQTSLSSSTTSTRVTLAESKPHLHELNDLPVMGLATLVGSYLFVARQQMNSIEVYNLNTLQFIRKVRIEPLEAPISLAAADTSVFIADQIQQRIYRLYVLDGEFWYTHFELTSSPARISVTMADNLLVTVPSEGRLEEFAMTGTLVRRVQLDSSIVKIWHAIEFSDDTYLVSHGGFADDTHRVCLVDSDGNILKYFGGLRGSSTAQLLTPMYMTLLEDYSILVADFNNFRIIKLDEKLEYVETVIESTANEDWPYCMWYNSNRQQLLVAYNTLATTAHVWSHGRVALYDL